MAEVIEVHTEHCTDAKEDSLHVNDSAKVILRPGRKSICSIKVEKIQFSIPFTIKVGTINGNVMRGSGEWVGGSWLYSAFKDAHRDFDG